METIESKILTAVRNEGFRLVGNGIGYSEDHYVLYLDGYHSADGNISSRLMNTLNRIGCVATVRKISVYPYVDGIINTFQVWVYFTIAK